MSKENSTSKKTQQASKKSKAAKVKKPSKKVTAGNEISKGDFILVDLIGRVKETNELFDVTVEDVAKKEKVYSEKNVYKPRLVVVGHGWVVKGLDEELQKMKVGDEKTIEIPPEKGFGVRDPKAIKVLPLREFRKQNIKPYPGMRLRLGGTSAVVKNVSSGRVTLDFNMPLAGKTLIYNVSIRKKLDTLIDKVKALIEWRVEKIPIDQFEIDLKGKKLKITLPESIYLSEGLQYAKRGIARDIYSYLEGIDEISFIENYPRSSFKTSSS
ncbi:MAG: FKBP-type peptidyl-prolyl cis-trans isomerase [Candidatus Odinarchaeia archaeon]